MRKKSLIITIFIFLLVFTGCNSGKNKEIKDATTENTSNEHHMETEEVDSEETINIENLEWFQEYGNRKILLTYVWADDASIYGLTKESADFIDKNDEIFPAENKTVVADLINKDITYKHIEKSYEKYTASIFELEGYLLSIEEADIEEFGLITMLHVMDDDFQSFQVMYFGELPDVFKEDIVYVVGLPIGMGGFENVSGGYTNTVVVLGSYIEKIE